MKRLRIIGISGKGVNATLRKRFAMPQRQWARPGGPAIALAHQFGTEGGKAVAIHGQSFCGQSGAG